MPLPTQRLHILTNDRLFTLLTLRCSALCALGLAFDAPCVAVFFNVRHALLEGITTFSTEKVTIVPMLA